MAAELLDEPRLAGLMVREASRRVRTLLRASPSFLWLLKRRAGEGERLLAVPLAIERGEGAQAEAIYGGVFPLAGQTLSPGGLSPFLLTDAPDAWISELCAFEWLRHLAEVEDALAAENARAHLRDFWALRRSQRPAAAARPEIAARRIVALLTHAPLILSRADESFNRRFIDALAREGRVLKRIAPEVSDGLPRLQVRIALAFLSLCVPGAASYVRPAAQHLSAELDRQIFPDGGHVSRNPDAIALLLKMLLPLRQLYGARSQAVPRSLFTAIDRMLPALRFFLHGDGAGALFNGAGAVPRGLVATLLRHDETLGEPMGHMRQSGYHRMAQGGTLILAETGLAPPSTVSGEAHAGTLAFEFSSGRQRFVVNCGASGVDEFRRLARSTAAHSTVTVGDRSSSRFPRSPRIGRFLGGPLVAGPTRVPATREDEAQGQRLLVAHDGYRAGFGLVHEREIVLARDGRRIEGADRLHRAAGRSAKSQPTPQASLRFHLHPDVIAEEAGRGVRLAADGQIWWFFADAPIALEESILFAGPKGPRRTRQIVIDFPPDGTQVEWCFERRH